MELDIGSFEDWFEKEGSLRKHRIICGDRVFFVNGHSLAEQSPFFEKLFFGDFKEAETMTFTIAPDSNIFEHEVFSYLAVVYGRQDVTVDTCSSVIRLSDLWDTPSLKAKCHNFLRSSFWSDLKPFDNVFASQSVDILEAAVLHGMKDYIVDVVNYLRKQTRKVLNDERLERVADTQVIAAIYDLAGKYSGKLFMVHEFETVKISPFRQPSHFVGEADAWKQFFSGYRNSTAVIMCSRTTTYSVDKSILFGEK